MSLSKKATKKATKKASKKATKKASKKASKKQSKKASKKASSKKTRISKKCLPYLSKKIGINVNEFKKKKRYSSIKQAIAVAYAQTNKKCSR